MTEDANASTTALPRTVSGSSIDHVMDQHLIPWALYDLSGARSPESLETMQDYSRSFRGLRGKSLNGISNDSLQRSWCAFIRRWNRMLEDGKNFQQWFANRAYIYADHSIGVLLKKLCENAWNLVDSATFTCTNLVTLVTRCLVQFAKLVNDTSLSINSANMSSYRSDGMSAA